jgi:hypothetical protein
MFATLTDARNFANAQICTVDLENNTNAPRPRFILHIPIATASSKYLQRSIAESTVVILHDVDPVLFNVYFNWLYSGSIYTKSDPVTEFPENQKDPEYITLTQLFLLGQLLEDENFMDDITDAFVSKFCSQRELTQDGVVDLPGPDCINLLYRFAGPETQLARVLADIYRREASKANLVQIRQALNKEFLADLAAALVDHRGQDLAKFADLDKCTFHSHSREETCMVEGRSRKRRRIRT